MNHALGRLKFLAFILLVSPVLLAPTGCHKSPGGLRIVPMKIGSKTYYLEIADNEITRMRGLMERESMPSDQGMIFVFARDDDRSFYMKNTLIPLDIVYVNSAGRVVSTHTMKPHDLTAIPADAPARWAIELNAGQLQACGVKAGDPIEIPKEAGGTVTANK